MTKPPTSQLDVDPCGTLIENIGNFVIRTSSTFFFSGGFHPERIGYIAYFATKLTHINQPWNYGLVFGHVALDHLRKNIHFQALLLIGPLRFSGTYYYSRLI